MKMTVVYYILNDALLLGSNGYNVSTLVKTLTNTIRFFSKEKKKIYMRKTIVELQLVTPLRYVYQGFCEHQNILRI